MKASKLIKRLEVQVEKHGDLNVRLVCDHGQVLMSPTWAGVGYVEDESEGMGEEIHPDSLERFPDAESVIIIEAF